VTYLLDTNVLSETRKRHPAPGVVNWIKSTPPDQLHVSVLTLGEITLGITHIRARGDHLQAAILERWLDGIEKGFADRALPVTARVAAEWGRQQPPWPVPVIDALIAATARVNGLTIVTRNLRDFESAGVPLINPFTE
jgi:predicted nucleic acid-binding protein